MVSCTLRKSINLSFSVLYIWEILKAPEHLVVKNVAYTSTGFSVLGCCCTSLKWFQKGEMIY